MDNSRPPWDRFVAADTSQVPRSPGLSLRDVVTLRTAYRARHGVWPEPKVVGEWVEALSWQDVKRTVVEIGRQRRLL